jgi:hypothetical protein
MTATPSSFRMRALGPFSLTAAARFTVMLAGVAALARRNVTTPVTSG